MTFTSTWHCCGVFLTPAPHMKLLAYLLTYLPVVGWAGLRKMDPRPSLHLSIALLSIVMITADDLEF